MAAMCATLYRRDHLRALA